VTAFNVTSRTSEIGIRMALGAKRADVLLMILRGAGAQILAGVLIGVPLALGAGQFLGSQLYGVSGHDPLAIGVAVLAIACSALVAAIIPANRASSVSPIKALRSE
jgi:ABC-type antimicrobial peptide transport system permease subunit